MGPNEKRSLLARKEGLSPVCQALYTMAFHDVSLVDGDIKHKASESSGTVTNAWNRLKGSPHVTPTHIPAVLSGIMDQIEALDTALKENPSGIAKLLSMMAELKAPSLELQVTEAEGVNSDKKNVFSQHLAHVFAKMIHNMSSTGFNLNNPDHAIVLQLLIDVAGMPVSGISRVPLLNFITEHSDAVKNWDVEKLNKILEGLPNHHLSLLNDKFDDSGTHSVLSRMLAWRYEANSTRGPLAVGTADNSQTSGFITLVEMLNLVTLTEVDSNGLETTFTLNYSDSNGNPLARDNSDQKDQAVDQKMASLIQLVDQKEYMRGPGERSGRMISK